MSRPGIVERIIRASLAYRNLLLAFALALTLVSAAITYQVEFTPDFPYHSITTRLEFDRSLENMFSPQDPLLVPFRQMRRTFGGDEVVVVAYVDPHLLTEKGIARLRTLADQLGQVPGVSDAICLAGPAGNSASRSDESNFFLGLWGQALHEPPHLRKDAQDADRDVDPALPMLSLFDGYLIGADRQTTAVLCLLAAESPQSTPRAKTIRDIRALAAAHDPSAVVTGEPVMVVDGFRYLEEDGARLGWATSGLLMLVIFLFFRSVRWMAIPLIVVQITLVWTTALLIVCHFRLSMVSSMLSAIITVVGIGTLVHVIVGVRDGQREGRSPEDALRISGILLALPIFWSCLTDAVGFGALLASQVGPVASFGAMTALGSLMTLLAVVFVTPGLALWRVRPENLQKVWGEDRLDAWLQRLAHGLENHPLTLTIVTTLLLAVMLAGHARIEIETDFTKNFRAGSPILTAYDFVEQRLGGAGVWDLYVAAPEQLDEPFLAKIRTLESRLRSELQGPAVAGKPAAGLTKVLSLVDVLDTGEAFGLRWAKTNVPAFFGQSAMLDSIRKYPLADKLKLVRSELPQLARAFHAQDPETRAWHYRVMLRAREQQSTREKQQLIDGVRRITQEVFPAPHTTGVTGYFVLLTHLIDSLLSDQWVTFGLAAGGIFLMMVVAFRSVTLALISLVPNALPILMVLGLMGHLGLKVNMGTVMIASVSMGLSIDSSVHYLTTFRRALAEGRTFAAAIDAVHQTVGRAMVFSTLALIVGFSALCLSHFVPTIYFGVLVSLAMLGGLGGNLVMLPLLLGFAHWCQRPRTPIAAEVESTSKN